MAKGRRLFNLNLFILGLLFKIFDFMQIFEDGMPNCTVFTSNGVHEYVKIDRLEEMTFSGKSDGE